MVVRIAVADILVRTLKSLGLEYPAIDKEKSREIQRAKRMLEKEY